MRLDDLRPELREKAENCKTPQEILELAKEEEIELSDEDLENVSGGWGGFRVWRAEVPPVWQHRSDLRNRAEGRRQLASDQVP